MKKILIAVSVVVVIGGGWLVLRNFRLSNPWLDGKWEEVARGDLEIPVSASGTIEGEELVEIKSKASGEVQSISVKEGMMVHKGQELVHLDPIDEKRNVETAQAEVERATAAYEQAKIRQEEAVKNRPLDVDMAGARLEAADAQLQQAQIEVDKLAGVTDKSDIECKRADANLKSQKATCAQAKVDLDRAKNELNIAIPMAAEDVRVAKALKEQAQKQLEEAQLRLRETRILSPTDGMVYAIRVRVGNLVQSGKTSLTGGTPIMLISNVGHMYVVAKVDEADIGAVRKIAPAFARPGETRTFSEDELMNPPTMPWMKKAPSTAPSSQAVAKAADAEAALRGQRVQVTVEAYRGETYEGVIERILPEPQLVQNVETFDVRIRLIGKSMWKLLSLQADVQFTSDRVNNVLKVKNESLVSEGKDVFVYIPHRENSNQPWGEKKVPVKIGLTDGTFTEIRGDALKQGDRVWVKRPQQTDKEKEKSGKA